MIHIETANTAIPSMICDLKSRLKPGIDVGSRLNTDGSITVATEAMLSSVAMNIVAPWGMYFLRFTMMNPITSMPRAASCSIMLISLLIGALVFSRLAMKPLICSSNKRSSLNTD